MASALAADANTIQLTAPANGFTNGAQVTGSGIAAGTTVTNIVGSTITLSLPTTAAIAANATLSMSGDVGNTVTAAAFAYFWQLLATVFVGNPGVFAYDLMNEPANMPNPATWPIAAQAAVNAIRSIDQQTLIIIEGYNYSSAGSWLLYNENLNIVDPANNLAYSPHLYLDRDSSGTYFSSLTESETPLASPPNAGQPHTNNVGPERALPPIEWGKLNNHSVIFGETGVPIDQSTNPSNTQTYNPNFQQNGWLVWLDTLWGYLQSLSIGTTYWNAGPYSSGYPLGIEPTVINGITVDSLTTAVVRKYTGVGVNSGQAVLTGPIRGQPSVASGEFVLQLHGYFTQETIVTPYDLASNATPAGGTFLQSGVATSSITLQPGFNPFAVVQYVPVSNPLSIEIGFTCPTGIAAVNTIGYSTIADPLAAEPSQPNNVFYPFMVNTTYLGALFRAYGVNETIEANGVSFYPGQRIVGGTVTESAIAAHIGGVSVAVTINGTPTQVTAWRVRLLDQGGLGNDQTIINGDNEDGPGGTSVLPGTLSDLPYLYFDSNGLPQIYWSNSRLVANSPIAGSTSQWFQVIAKPNTVASMQWCMGWTFTDQDQITGDGNGNWLISNGTTSEFLAMGIKTDTLRIYGGQFQAGVANGRQTTRDGILVTEITSTFSSISDDYRGDIVIGFYKFYPEYFSGIQNGFTTFNNSIPLASTQTALFAATQAFYGTPVPPAQVTGLELGTTTYDSQALTWNAAAGATAYVVQTAGGTGIAPQTFTTTNGIVTGLAPLTTYSYTVYATDGYGIGLTSSPVSAETLVYPSGPGPFLSAIAVNVAGMENYPSPIIPDTTTIPQYFYGKGISVIRFCFNQQSLMPVLLGPLVNSPYLQSFYGSGFDYLGTIDNYVAVVTGLGFKIALDCHNYGTLTSHLVVASSVASGTQIVSFDTTCDAFTTGAAISGTGIPSSTTIVPTLGSATITLSKATTAVIPAGTVLAVSGSIGTTVTNAAFADMWGKITARYAHNPNVIIGSLNNEPQVASTVLSSAYNAAFVSIRAAEAAAGVSPHKVWAPVPGYNASGVSTAFLNSIVDSGNNHIFEVHQYNDSSGSGTSPDVVSLTIGAERLSSATVLARANGARFILGEFATGADPLNTSTPALECYLNELRYLQKNADVWDTPAHWASGDFNSVLAPSPYYYGISPYQGQDTPWISILQKFMPGGSEYGYHTTLPQIFNLTLSSGATFVTASETAFGQALTGGYGSTSSPLANLVQFSLDVRIVLPSNITLNCVYGQYAAIGYDGAGFVGVDNNGHACIYGDRNPAINTTVRINDGNPHLLTFDNDGVTQRLFVDGALVGSQPYTGISTATPAQNGVGTVGLYKTDTPRLWPGSIEYAAIWGVARGANNFTPPTSPLTGNEANLIVVWNLDGNGIGYA